jgi:hypothetical protein
MRRVFQSWKQIAEYVGRTERTVQRWEQEFGFPVHRPSGRARSSVMALAQEIQEWTRGKPSLVQIRANSRVPRGIIIPHANRTFPSSNTFKCIPDFSKAKTLLDQVKLERLRQSSLVAEQKKLREDVRHLRNEQRGLLASLRRNVSKKGN